MLNKLSRVKPTSKVGIIKIKLFEVYSKKKFSNLKFFGSVKGSVNKANKKRKFLIGYKIKSYVVQTKQTLNKLDGTKLFFFNNKSYIKHKKLRKHRKNYGPVQKNIFHKKMLFKFPIIL